MVSNWIFDSNDNVANYTTTLNFTPVIDINEKHLCRSQGRYIWLKVNEHVK